MQKRKIVLAFSGGLDTSYCLVVLRQRGEEVITVTVDTGGFSVAELDRIEARSKECGATDHIVVDGRERLYDEFVSYILKANYLRNGAYPSCVGAERMLQAEEVTTIAVNLGAEAVAHGSTGAGNDHVRFDAVPRAIAPDLDIIALIRDEQHAREDERDFLREHGHEVRDLEAKYSFNSGILGTTIGGEETYGSWEYLPEEAWPRTSPIADAPNDPLDFIVGFDRGLPATLDGIDFADPIGVAGYDIIATLNHVGAIHGVGRGIHTGQTIMGTVGRLGFEAPGMLILIAAHRELERLVLTNRQQSAKAALGGQLGDLLHEGVYYDPILDDLRAFLDSSQARVTGDVRVRLHKGTVTLLGSRSPYSLLDASQRVGVTYGHGADLWTGEEARSFAHLYSTAGRLAKSAGAVDANES